MERKGQGAIEYLLIIGAAILVVAIVIVAITSVVNTGKTQPGMNDQNKALNVAKCSVNINSLGGTCTVSGTPPTLVAGCGCCDNTQVGDKTQVKNANNIAICP